MKASLVRSFGALVTTCAVLLAMTGPAAAAAVSMTSTSGTVVVSRPPFAPLNIPLAGGSCPAATMQTDMSSTTAGTVTATSFNSVTPFLWSGTTYLYTLTLGTTGSAAGAYVEATGTLTGLKVPLRIQIHTVSTTNPCVGATLLCTWTTLLTLSSTNLFAHSSSSTATMTGTGTALVLGGACNAPFSTYTSGAVTVTGWTVHMT